MTGSPRRVAANDPQDPENISPRHAKRALHHAVRGGTLCDLEPAVLESIAGLDGAVVIDTGRTPAHLRRDPANRARDARAGACGPGRANAGRPRRLQHGPVLKVSEDGYLTMFLKGRRVWEL